MDIEWYIKKLRVMRPELFPDTTAKRNKILLESTLSVVTAKIMQVIDPRESAVLDIRKGLEPALGGMAEIKDIFQSGQGLTK
jgi:hypothetical protein